MNDGDELESIDAEIVELTGERFHLYTSRPGDGQTRVVFKDGVKLGYRSAVNHAERFLSLMRNPTPCDTASMHGCHEWQRDGMALGCRGVL